MEGVGRCTDKIAYYTSSVNRLFSRFFPRFFWGDLRLSLGNRVGLRGPHPPPFPDTHLPRCKNFPGKTLVNTRKRSYECIDPHVACKRLTEPVRVEFLLFWNVPRLRKEVDKVDRFNICLTTICNGTDADFDLHNAVIDLSRSTRQHWPPRHSATSTAPAGLVTSRRTRKGRHHGRSS